MPTPRVFISSTCYDLKDIRFQIRSFVEEFGFEPVMSEFGDIFYNYEEHVQDACIQEINKCQLFLLIIGDNYGSFYHGDKDDELPDSVTLKEFKSALENEIYKHIFINKFVDHDYKNYKRSLEKVVLKFFQDNDVPDEKTSETRERVKQDFDEGYPFPKESYRYTFYFLDLVYSLNKNNAIFQFESFDEIKESLRKQWAGFMYDSIIKENSVPVDLVNKLSNKIDNLESRINKLLDTKKVKKDSKITFDIGEIVKDLNIENLKEVQDKANKALSVLLYEHGSKRVEFKEAFDEKLTKEWINNLEDVVKSYKWSKFVEFEIIFKNTVPYRYWRNRTSVPYEVILELYTIVKSFDKDDLKAFIKTVEQEFNKLYSPEIDDDLPF